MSVSTTEQLAGVPCGCCKAGRHIIKEVAAGRDHMTCDCSRKKCYLCLKCIIHCGCKAKMASLEQQLSDALARAERTEGEAKKTDANCIAHYNEIRSLRTINEQLSGDCLTKEILLGNADTVIRLKDAEFEAMKAELAAAKQEATGATLQLNTLRPKLEDCEKALKGAGAEAKMLQRENELLRGSNNHYHENAQEACVKINQQEQAIASLQSSLAAATAQAKDLSEKLGETYGRAVNFATHVFNKESSGLWGDKDKWRVITGSKGNLAAEYLYSTGLLEKHELQNWYRWLPMPAKGEGSE